MKLPKHFMGLIFLVMALDLTATGMGFLGKAFGEGTYFYWNIESVSYTHLTLPTISRV